MFRPRAYTVTFTTSGSTVALDWFELTSTASSGLMLLGVDISQTTEFGDAQDEMIGWYIKRASGTYTSGSGGNSSVARAVVNAGDGAATITAETANTTQIAVGTGTLTTVHQGAFNVRVGLQLFWTPETAITTSVSQALAIGMLAAPADAVSWVGTAYVGELVP